MAPELRRDTMAPQWWSQPYDLAAGEALVKDRFHASWIIAYHARQAAEKFIKAYLVACGMSPDERGFRTHEIDDLRLLVRRFEEELAESLAMADELSEYAVEARYPAIAPGIDEQVSPDVEITDILSPSGPLHPGNSSDLGSVLRPGRSHRSHPPARECARGDRNTARRGFGLRG